jgi:flagellar biosynthesis/type III secretory pathway chaperone
MPRSAVQFAAAIQIERAGLEALVAALEQEHHALEQRHTDRLTQIATTKRELLLHLAHLGDQRNRMLEQSGMGRDRTGMKRWLQVHDHNGVAQNAWRALVEITHHAQQMNRRNGIYIEADARENRRALQALLAASAAAGTYGPADRAINPLSSRSLASA